MAAITAPTAIRPTLTTTLATNRAVLFGATISTGQAAYLDSTDSKYKLADSNSTLALAAAVGVFVTPGIDAGYGYVATGGSIILVGTTLVVGTTYCVGSTAGSIVPISDLTTGDYVTILGTAATTTQLDLAIKASGIVKP